MKHTQKTVAHTPTPQAPEATQALSTVAGGTTTPGSFEASMESAVFPRSLDDLVDYDRRVPHTAARDEGRISVRCPRCELVFEVET